jgi:hypothetical protein
MMMLLLRRPVRGGARPWGRAAPGSEGGQRHGPGEGAHPVRGGIHGETGVAAPRHVRRRVGRPLLVVRDRFTAHRAERVQAVVAAHPADDRPEWPPPDAPDRNPEQRTRTADGAAVRRSNQLSAAAAPWLARLGVLRLSGYIQTDPDLPLRRRAELRAFTNGTRFWESYAAVFRVVEQTMAEVRASGTLGSTPLLVLTATEHGFSAEMEQLHQELQAELAGLSSDSRHRVVGGATHVSLVDDREQAQITVGAIREVVEASASGRPLGP